MYSSLFLLTFIFNAIFLVEASIFVIKPELGSTCHGGQECTIEWLDDGRSPLLTAIGLCNFGLFTGNQQLIQALPSADVATTHSLTFVPMPGAGPNADAYYIGIVSAGADENKTVSAFSPSFRLDQMTGSFETPLPAATSAVSTSIPATTSSTPLSTITIPSITASTTSAASATTSGFVTSAASVSTATSASASSPSPSSSILISIPSPSLSQPESAPVESTVPPSSLVVPSASSTSLSRFLTSATSPLPTGITVGTTTTNAPVSASPPSSGAPRMLSAVSYLMAGALVSVLFLSL